MVATIVTHMMISLNNHVGRAPNTNASFKNVATIQQFENVTEIKYKSVIEQEQQPPSGSQAYQYNLNEPAITISEVSLTRVKNAVRTISESANAITASLVKKVTHLISEPAKSITENLVKSKTANRTITQNTSIGESLAKRVGRVRTISEPANTIGESLGASKNYNRTISESAITVTDSLAKHTIKVRQLTEPHTNISETLIHLKVAQLTETPITITEALAVSRILSRTISEFAYTSSSFTFASFSSPIPITERLSKTVTHNITQSTAITENLIKLRTAVRNLSETVLLQPEIIQRLVLHYMNEPAVNVTESLTSSTIRGHIIIEPPITITDSLVARRDFKRSINPTSFSDASFTTGVFESFNVPPGDVTLITEELEGFVLPPGVFNLIEPAIDITESLVSHRTVFRTITEDPITIGESLTGTIPSVITTGGGGGVNRRRIRRARYNTYLRTLQPVKTPIPEPEPEHEPLLFEIDISEPPIAIHESLTALTIRKEKVIVSVAAAAPPPQIIEKEIEKIVYVEKEKLVEIQPPPIIRAQDIIVSKPKPIETEQEILISTQSHSNRMKSKAASARIQVLEKLMMLTEMEEAVS